jgi:hypothetical protein
MGIISVAFAKERNIYTIFYNSVSDGFNIPLIGFANVAKGDHSSAQIGFVNTNIKNFNGFQAGFVNTAGENVVGFQASFVNTSGGMIYGTQTGFVNTAQHLQGAQFGYINTAALGANGLQTGFVNTALFLDGAQLGFVNTSLSKTRGAQIGFVNISAKSLNGVQIGFINVIDTVESGIPIGFLSIVRRGGYKAFEYYFTNQYPTNMAFKFGLEKFYTSINFAIDLSRNNYWHSSKESFSQYFAFGGGFGAMFYINDFLFINPEIIHLNTSESSQQQLLSFAPLFGFEIGKRFAITAGPTVDLQSCDKDSNGLKKPVFTIADYSFYSVSSKNNASLGIRAGARVRF